MNTFYYLLLLHFIGDFVFQSRRIAENKSSDFRVMIHHCLILAAVFGVGMFSVIPSFDAWMCFILALFGTHYLQDTFVWRSYKWLMTQRYRSELDKFEYWKDSGFWSTIGFDQMFHVATLYFLWRVFI